MGASVAVERRHRPGAAGLARAIVDRLAPHSMAGWIGWTLAIAGVVTLAVVAAGADIPWLAWDTGAYWDALRSSHPYAGSRVGGLGAYLYSPVFLQVLAPLGWLPWAAFVFGWTAMNTAASIALIRRTPEAYRALVPFLAALAVLDVWAGNINVLLAWALVLGVRHASSWAFVLVTKVTPGIGLLWFLLRRQWAAFTWAVVLTAGMVGVSALLAPQLWRDWIALLLSEAQPGLYPQAVTLPWIVRLPLAVVLLWWGARRDQPAVVPLAGFLCLPVIWVNGFAVLVGVPALLRSGGLRTRRPAVDHAAA